MTSKKEKPKKIFLNGATTPKDISRFIERDTIKGVIEDMMGSMTPEEQINVEEILNGSDMALHEKEYGIQWSDWEKEVKEKLQESSIEFEVKHRKFPLEVDTRTTNYEPDFILDFSYKNRRRVIVEVQESMSMEDVKKYQTFVDVYGRVYWLILVVTEGKLRNWNEISAKGLPVSHEIWTLSGINDMISKLEKLRTKIKENDKKEKATCPRCSKTAQGKFEVTKLFGYRYEGKRVQSHCRTCRSTKKDITSSNDSFQQKPKMVDCTFCKKNYLEKVRGESCCEECLKKFN